jgi:hypothetical protein
MQNIRQNEIKNTTIVKKNKQEKTTLETVQVKFELHKGNGEKHNY